MGCKSTGKKKNYEMGFKANIKYYNEYYHPVKILDIRGHSIVAWDPNTNVVYLVISPYCFSFLATDKY